MAELRGETVRNWTAEAQGLDTAPERAQQIAAAIAPIGEVARQAAPKLPFDSEPALFVVVQRRWAGTQP
jgi:hypothetical protein